MPGLALIAGIQQRPDLGAVLPEVRAFIDGGVWAARIAVTARAKKAALAFIRNPPDFVTAIVRDKDTAVGQLHDGHWAPPNVARIG